MVIVLLTTPIRISRFTQTTTKSLVFPSTGVWTSYLSTAYIFCLPRFFWSSFTNAKLYSPCESPHRIYKVPKYLKVKSIATLIQKQAFYGHFGRTKKKSKKILFQKLTSKKFRKFEFQEKKKYLLKNHQKKTLMPNYERLKALLTFIRIPKNIF